MKTFKREFFRLSLCTGLGLLMYLAMESVWPFILLYLLWALGFGDPDTGDGEYD